MPRIPYRPEDESEPADVVAAMRARRGGKLNEADRMVLNAPAFARGFNLLMGAVRGELSLPAKLRELAVCGVAALNGSTYEIEKHAPEFLKAGGTAAQLEVLTRFEEAAKNAALFDEAERAVMQLTIEMTKVVTVSDETFAAAAATLSGPQQVVELVGVISSYNMVSRLLMALGVESG